MSGSIDRALRVIAAHPNVVSICANNTDTGSRQVDVAIRLGLPNAWMADGHSPNGIRSIEPVTFLFPASFPLKAPTLRLRADFDRSLAHVRPGEPGDQPEPCVFEGNLTELLLQQGVAGIINQLVVWLENTALETLINPAQGWEPVRRDGLRDFIVADAAVLRGLVSRKAGYAAFGLDYWSFTVDGGALAVHGEIDRERLTLNPKTTPTVFTEWRPVKGKDWRLGRSLALVSWPGRHASGDLVIADRYQPETVTNVGNLLGRADEYGCGESLRTGLR
jgi:Prokaryotic E2 family A